MDYHSSLVHVFVLSTVSLTCGQLTPEQTFGLVLPQLPASQTGFQLSSDGTPTVQRLEGLAPSQQGFVVTNPGFHPNSESAYTDEQKRQIKLQQDFRKSVAEANRNRKTRPQVEQEFVNEEFPSVVTQTQSRDQNFEQQSQTFQQPPLVEVSNTGRQKNRAPLGQAPIRQRVIIRNKQQPARQSSDVGTQQNFNFQPALSQATNIPVQTLQAPVRQTFQQMFDDLPSNQDFQQVQSQNDFQSSIRQGATKMQFQSATRSSRPTRPNVRIINNVDKPQFDEELFRQQAENAKYSFSSSVSDSINDNSHFREETRDGLKLAGVYSYSDGFYRRTVHYEADENGYRIVKEETEAIGSGPQPDPAGSADVSSSIGGANLHYRITGTDVPNQSGHHQTS